MLLLSLSAIHLKCCTDFFGPLLNCTSHIIIKVTAIQKVRQLDNRGEITAEIFLQPKLSCPVCVVWYRVLLSDVRSSSSHPLNPEQCYLFQSFDIDLMLSLRPCGKMNESINSPSLVTTLNTMIWIGCLIFININLFSD